MKFECPNCHQLLEGEEARTSETIPCPTCGESIIVPVPAKSVSPPPPTERKAAPVPKPVPNYPIPSRRKGMPGFVMFLLFVILLEGAAFGYTMINHDESPQQVRKRLLGGQPRPAKQNTAPTPILVATVAPEATQTSPPTPPPATSTETQAKPDPVAWLLAKKDRWPKEVKLMEPQEFPVVANGKVIGSVSVPAGTSVKVIAVEPKTVAVMYQGGGARVPHRATNLLQWTENAMQRVHQLQLSPTVPQPVERAAVPASSVAAPDRMLVFGTGDAGVSKPIPTWGLDTAWLDPVNVRRGAIFMGKPQVDVVRVSFTPYEPLVNRDYGKKAQADFDKRMWTVDTYTEPDTAIYLNFHGPIDDVFKDRNHNVLAGPYAEVIDLTRRKCEAAGRTVVSVAPFNEPDFDKEQGDVSKLRELCQKLRSKGRYGGRGTRLCGASTLNCDQANVWYEPVKDLLDEGNTHQLAGSFDNYAAFYQNVRASGDHAANDELHSIVEAMVGAEYGMQTGIWWGSAERARGEFVKTSDGVRLAYAEHRPNWTAASVYRGPNGAVQAFVSESERQAMPTVYRFFSKDRDVFYDGDGPRRDFTVTTTGGPGYQTPAHHGAERVVNVTWGDDVQPLIDGRYLVVNRASGKVLEVAGANADDGAPLQQNKYSGGKHQQWDVNPLPKESGGDYSYFTLKAAHSGRNADESGFSFDDGNPINQYGTEANPVRHWYLEYAGDNFFRIHSRWSGMCMAPSDGSKKEDAPIVQTTPDEKDLSQQWRLMPVEAAVEFNAPAAPAGLTAAAGPVAVTLKWPANREADLASYTILRSTAAKGPFDIIARGVTATSYTDGSANQSIPYFYTVKAVDRSLNVSAPSVVASATPSGAPAAVAEYAFEGSTYDSTSNFNDASWVGAAAYDAGLAGQAIALDGNSNYVTLPPEVANFDQITVAA